MRRPGRWRIRTCVLFSMGLSVWGCLGSSSVYAHQATTETPRVPASLTLSAAIEYARRWHPRLHGARALVHMAQGEAVTASLFPNPAVTFSGENFPSQRDRDLEWFAFLSQTIETGRKRHWRMEVAKWALRMAEATAQETERRVIAEVKLAYERALLERARLELARENLETFRQIVRYNEVRVAEGYTAEGDLIKVRLEAQRAEFALQQARLDYERAKIELLRAMGASSFDHAFELQGELDFEPVLIDFRELERVALERPEAVRARAEFERARALWELERAQAKPDITISFGYKRNGPENTLYGAVSLPLPIFNRNQGQLERAKAEREWAEAQWRLTRGEILAELTAAYRALEIAAEQVQTLRHEFLQRAEDARAVAVAAYREGAVDLLTLLEAQRAQASARELYMQALFEYRRAVHEVERAAGLEHLPRRRTAAVSSPEGASPRTSPRRSISP